ncbi:MAG: hypothetical protein ACFFDI_30780 [Promethearchaeota archaeon]
MKEEFRNLLPVQRKIVKILWKTKRKHRKQLVNQLGIARTTIHDNLSKGIKSLKGRGIVDFTDECKGVGRPPRLWYLTEDFINDIESDLKFFNEKQKEENKNG